MSRRLLFVTAVVLVAAIPCAADPAGTPATTPVFTVTCDVDGVQTLFYLVGTGVTGHVLEDNRIAFLLNSTFTFFVTSNLVTKKGNRFKGG